MVVVVVVVGVVPRHLLDAGGDAPHRLHVRLRGHPAPRPPPFGPPPPPGSHAPSCLSLGARGALALALGPLSSPCPCRGSRPPSPTPWPARSPTAPRPAPCTWAPCSRPCAPFPCPGPFPAPCPESRRPLLALCPPPLLRPCSLPRVPWPAPGARSWALPLSPLAPRSALPWLARSSACAPPPPSWITRRVWVTGVPITYTALPQFNKVYVQNQRLRDKVARAADITEAKADVKSKSKKRSEEEMEHNEENQDNAKKKRRRSGDTRRSTAHKPGAQSSTNKERQRADHETAVPASPAETAKTTTSEHATTPSSVSSARATNDPRGEPGPPTPSTRPSATPLTDTEKKASEEAQGQKMVEDDGSEGDTPQGTMDDEARNDGDEESSQKLESSEETRCILRKNEKKPRYTLLSPAKQICIPKSGAARKWKATGGREAEPMELKGRREPPQSLQEVNAVINKIYWNS